MTGAENVSILFALTAGLISFLSPCVLPLIPSYIAFISGISIEELSHETNLTKVRKSVIINSLMFILGFSILFIALGASVTFFGKFLSRNIRWFEIIGGSLVIILGLHFAGVFKIGFLNKEKKIHLKSKPVGLVGTMLVGMAFGAGWTPCVGPILAAILTMAASTQDIMKGVVLLIAYSIGLGIPFFISGLLINKFFSYFTKIRKYFKIITAISGMILVLIGILLMTGYFSAIAAYLNQ